MPLETRETNDAVLLKFPMNGAINEQLKATFPQARFDKQHSIWVVPTPNDGERAKVHKFVPDLAMQVDAAEKSFKNARLYVEAHDPAKFPGLRIEARSERLAVFTVGPDGRSVGVRSAVDAIKQIPDVRWVREWNGPDQKTGQNVTRGGYWAVPMADGADPTRQLTIAAGEMSKFGREIGMVAQLQPEHPGMTVSSGTTKDGAVMVLQMARDPNANAIAKTAGMTWSRDHDGYAMPLNEGTIAKGKETIAKIDAYMGSMALQPTLGQTGLTDKALAGAASLDAVKSPEADVKAYKALIDGALTPNEQKLLASATPETYRAETTDRLAAIPADKFAAVQGAVTNVNAVHMKAMDVAMERAVAEISRTPAAPAQAMAQG